MTSRKKEVERLQTAELAKSNIQRPFIRFDMKRPSGRHPLEIKGLSKTYDDLTGDSRTSPPASSRGEKIALMGRNGAGKTTLLKSLLRNAPGSSTTTTGTSPIDAGTVTWGHEVAVGYFCAGSQQIDRHGDDHASNGCTSSIRRRRRRNCAGCSARCCSAATMR